MCRATSGGTLAPPLFTPSAPVFTALAPACGPLRQAFTLAAPAWRDVLTGAAFARSSKKCEKRASNALTNRYIAPMDRYSARMYRFRASLYRYGALMDRFSASMDRFTGALHPFTAPLHPCAGATHGCAEAVRGRWHRMLHWGSRRLQHGASDAGCLWVGGGGHGLLTSSIPAHFHPVPLTMYHPPASRGLRKVVCFFRSRGVAE